jgi:hypothetical protein
MDRRRLFTTIAWLGGPLVWAAYFLFVYASESIACRYSEASSHAWLVALSTMAAALSIIVVTAFLTRHSRDGATVLFMRFSGLGLSVSAAIAVIWTAVPPIARSRHSRWSDHRRDHRRRDPRTGRRRAGPVEILSTNGELRLRHSPA